MQVGNKIVINETAAESVSHVLTHGMEAETIQTLDRTIKMPLNCDRLRLIVCNPEVFKQAPGGYKNTGKGVAGRAKSPNAKPFSPDVSVVGDHEARRS